ncbi:unnamed protein product [Gadus morhua 'NCC']
MSAASEVVSVIPLEENLRHSSLALTSSRLEPRKQMRIFSSDKRADEPHASRCSRSPPRCKAVRLRSSRRKLQCLHIRNTTRGAARGSLVAAARAPPGPNPELPERVHHHYNLARPCTPPPQLREGSPSPVTHPVLPPGFWTVSCKEQNAGRQRRPGDEVTTGSNRTVPLLVGLQRFRLLNENISEPLKSARIAAAERWRLAGRLLSSDAFDRWRFQVEAPGGHARGSGGFRRNAFSQITACRDCCGHVTAAESALPPLDAAGLRHGTWSTSKPGLTQDLEHT